MITRKWLPEAMPLIRKDPGEFMVEQSLPPETSERVPAVAETAAAKSLALGYGVTAGVLYAALCRNRDGVIVNGAALGLGTWAVAYGGWLPALDRMPPLTGQTLQQATGSVIHHVRFGVATVAAYRWLKRLA